MFEFHNVMCYKNVLSGYDIRFLQDLVDAFFFFFEYNNINITHAVFDGVVDWDKEYEFGVREKKNLEVNEEIWNNSLVSNSSNVTKWSDCQSMYQSLFFEYHFMKCIRNHVPLDKIVFTGVHAPRFV